ncbi:winged helix-turn-helix domain-containing protein [Gorillibacterium sp. sgz5001074]|uniref:winged helix-turn-helix domain-containing protein n=1 Tax=Gorillibacterium sp. sgz5001074 TaxID=3446695 RepID=UPI003F665D35
METNPMEWNPAEQSHVLAVGPLRFNRQSFQVFSDDRDLLLTVKEFCIFMKLAEHQNQVLERSRFAGLLAKDGQLFDPGSLTIHIKNIRSKLGSLKTCIKTVWGVGYEFVGFPSEHASGSSQESVSAPASEPSLAHR